MQNSYEWLTLLSAGFCAACLVGCASEKHEKHPMAAAQVSHQPWGKTKDGTPVTLYTLRNGKGAEVQICNYGGIVVSLKVPDRNGHVGDVVLGYDKLEDYIK